MDISLNSERKVFARKTECRILTSDEAKLFMEENHRQGSVKDKTVSCGIFLKEELVGVISFCSPRTSAKREKYTRELVRLCFKSGVKEMTASLMGIWAVEALILIINSTDGKGNIGVLSKRKYSTDSPENLMPTAWKRS